MNTSRLVTLGLGALGVFVLAGVALGGAAAMAVPGPQGPVGNTAGAVVPSCTIAVALYESVNVAQINQVVVFSTGISVHSTGHAVCATVSGLSYSNLPAGPYSDPALTCSSANTPVLSCAVGSSGVFDVTVSAHLSNGTTVNASTWLFVSPIPA